MTPPDPPADAGRLLTLAELAARKGVPESLLYKLKADGLIAFAQRCPGGMLWFEADALDRVTTRPGPPAAAGPAPAPAEGPPKRLSGRRPKWQAGA